MNIFLQNIKCRMCRRTIPIGATYYYSPRDLTIYCTKCVQEFDKNMSIGMLELGLNPKD